MNLFEISNLETRLNELEEQTGKQEFWENNDNTTKVLSEIKLIKNKYTKLTKSIATLNFSFLTLLIIGLFSVSAGQNIK